MVSLLEEQAALLHKHINTLKQLSADGKFDSAEPEDGHKKKVKAPKDPNRPKRPLSGYQLFMADNNAKFKEEYPEASATEIMSLVAKAWATVEAGKKEVYLQKASVLKDEYTEKVTEYVANKAEHEDDDHETAAAAPAPKKKEPKAPKPAASSSSSSSAPPAKKPAAVAAVVPTPTPVVVPVVTAAVATPSSKKSSEEKSSKKHKRAESMGSEENVIFTATSEADESAKKKKVSCVVYSTWCVLAVISFICTLHLPHGSVCFCPL